MTTKDSKGRAERRWREKVRAREAQDDKLRGVTNDTLWLSSPMPIRDPEVWLKILIANGVAPPDTDARDEHAMFRATAKLIERHTNNVKIGLVPEVPEADDDDPDPPSANPWFEENSEIAGLPNAEPRFDWDHAPREADVERGGEKPTWAKMSGGGQRRAKGKARK